MTSPTLSVTTRTVVGKQARALRNQGIIPAVMYGHKKESVNLAVERLVFNKLYQEVGSSTLVDLSIDGKKPVKVLIHDVQKDAVTHAPEHVDFYIVNLKEKLQTAIPLVFAGTADAVETLGGTLLTSKDELNVECLPEDLVSEIAVDIAQLATFDDVIRISDIAVPAGITVLDEADETVASVAEPITQAELDSLEETVVDTAAEVESETKSGTEGEPTEEEK